MEPTLCAHTYTLARKTFVCVARPDHRPVGAHHFVEGDTTPLSRQAMNQVRAARQDFKGSLIAIPGERRASS